MTRLLKNTIGHIIVALFLSLPAFTQTPADELKHFSADGLSFDYLPGWTVTDRSTEQAQRLILTRKGSSVEISILAQRDLIMRAQMADARRDIAEPLIAEMAQKTGASLKALERTPTNLDVGLVKAEGVRFHASPGGKKKTGEVYWLRLGLRFVNLAYVRADRDEAQGTAAWETVHLTLKIESPVIAVGTQEPSASPSQGQPKIETGDDDVLNKKSSNLPRPVYPNIARAARAFGVVKVQVTIDEQGKVIAAHAVSGHPLLQAAAVKAARQAKFAPTLLDGEPVKVAGIITYNFQPPK